MLREIVNRAVDGPSFAKEPEMAEKHIGFEGVRVVVIDELSLFESFVVLGAVIIIVVDNGHAVREFCFQSVSEGGFSRTGAAGDSNQIWFHDRSSMLCGFISYIIRQRGFFVNQGTGKRVKEIDDVRRIYGYSQ